MRDPAPWQRKYELMAVCSLGFGLISQYLFIGNALGLSVLLFAAMFYGLFFYAVKGRIGGFDQWRGQSKSGWLLLLPIALLAVSYVLFHNELFRSLNMIVLPALVAAQTVLLSRSSAKPWYRVAFYQDVIYLALIKPVSYFTVPFGLVTNRLAPKRDGEEGKARNGKLRRIALGLLLAAPPLIVVIVLLASADRIFLDLVVRLPELFGGLSVGTLLGRVLLAGIITLYAFCYLWTLLFRKSGDGWKEYLKEVSATSGVMPSAVKLDPLTAVTLLMSFNFVYIIFAAIQFSYLFGAANGLLPAGAAYADYARQGFAQLVIVSLINLALLLGGLHGIRTSGKAAETGRKLSLSMLVGCTLVMLISAFSRLSLYESAYGYTQTRILVHGFMIFLGVILIVSFIRIWRDHFSLAKAYIGLAVAAYVVMNYVNVDAIIAEQNMHRYEAHGEIDLDYLGSLSSDAYPAIKEMAALAPGLQPGTDEILSKMQAAAQNRGGWPSWNLSVSRVLNSMDDR
ncbi:DUF4153 domain-containing protein [Paenibacillus silvisoli]|uniref:DUF4153 domain-containing protein n=1 Tax=Paenibacillus silvisoli TaxID=3110539 RepID=UPI0028057CC6|nr:DUF4173 domain-containing protein [Paenibacillus silvisoli]